MEEDEDVDESSEEAVSEVGIRVAVEEVEDDRGEDGKGEDADRQRKSSGSRPLLSRLLRLRRLRGVKS